MVTGRGYCPERIRRSEDSGNEVLPEQRRQFQCVSNRIPSSNGRNQPPLQIPDWTPKVPQPPASQPATGSWYRSIADIPCHALLPRIRFIDLRPTWKDHRHHPRNTHLHANHTIRDHPTTTRSRPASSRRNTNNLKTLPTHMSPETMERPSSNNRPLSNQRHTLRSPLARYHSRLCHRQLTAARSLQAQPRHLLQKPQTAP